MKNRMKSLAFLVSKAEDDIVFTMLEIGALPLETNPEKFYQLVDLFPGSQVIGFEIDSDLCEKLNKETKDGFIFHPLALGEKDEERAFYETAHPMCCSLYKPNKTLLDKFINLDPVALNNTRSILTRSLDSFAQEYGITDVDFIKIDIQGAELDVFKGGVNTLEGVVAIVSEVEFIPLYENQPLFGDVSRFLSAEKLMFHHFLGYAGRTLKPITLNNNPNFISQQMWSDALYLTDVVEINSLSNKKLLKMAVISSLYDCVDVAFHCLSFYDEKNGTDLKNKYMKLLRE